MGLIQLTSAGKLTKTIKFLNWALRYSPEAILHKYGKIGVEALRNATPVDSGETANSWYYTVDTSEDEFVLTWCNRNVNDGCNVAVLLQYGHGTKSGTYVQGLDYINPALVPIFELIYKKICEEVSGQ